MANKPTYKELEHRVKELEKQIVKLEQTGSKLTKSEEKLRAQFKSLPVPTYTWKRVEKDFVLVDYNNAAEAITRGKIVKLLGKKVSDLYRDRSDVIDDFRHCFIKKTTVKRESLFRLRSTGERKYLSVTYAFIPPEFVLVHTEDIDDRKRAEKSLQKSEEKLDAMLRSIGDHMSMMDKDLNIVWANKTAKKVFGNNIVGKKCFEAYHNRKEPCEPYPCSTIKAFQHGTFHEHETKAIDKDGKIVYFHCTADVALRDKEGKPKTVLEISRDITDRKNTEKDLRKSREKLDGIVKSIPDAMIMMDKDFNILWTNDIAKRLAGPDLISNKCYATFHKRDTVCEPCIVRQCLEDGRVHEFETEMTDKKGNQKVFWCTASVAARAEEGHPTMVVESLRNITEQKHAQTKIEELKQQLEFILGATKTGLDIIDSDYNIRFIDPEWKKVYGDPAERKCYEYFMDNSKPCPGCGITKAMETKKPVVTEEVLVKEDNRPIQVTTIPFQNKKGEWLFAEVNVDITERKQVEEALQERKAALKARTAELEETNSALRVLLKRIGKDKKELEEKVMLNLKELVSPQIEKLKSCRLDAKSMTFLSLLESNLKDFISPFAHMLSSKYFGFTPTEIQVASLVRGGKTTKEIATLLNSSYRTIESHRQNIRKKIGIKKEKTNLRSCLLSM